MVPDGAEETSIVRFLDSLMYSATFEASQNHGWVVETPHHGEKPQPPRELKRLALILSHILFWELSWGPTMGRRNIVYSCRETRLFRQAHRNRNKVKSSNTTFQNGRGIYSWKQPLAPSVTIKNLATPNYSSQLPQPQQPATRRQTAKTNRLGRPTGAYAS